MTDCPWKGLDVSKYIVSVRDDGDPSLTFRSIVLGSAFTALSSVITMLYTFKPYQVSVSATFLQRKLCFPNMHEAQVVLTLPSHVFGSCYSSCLYIRPRLGTFHAPSGKIQMEMAPKHTAFS